MQAVLRERGLERTVYRFGLASQVDPRAAESGLAGRDGFTPFERTAIDVARCLVRRPDILVVGLALDDRGAPEVMAGIERLRAARAGRGLVVCLPAECRPDEAAPFDVVLRPSAPPWCGPAGCRMSRRRLSQSPARPGLPAGPRRSRHPRWSRHPQSRCGTALA